MPLLCASACDGYVAMTLTRATKLSKTTFDRMTAVASLETLKSLCNELEGSALPADEHFDVIFKTVSDFLNLQVCNRYSAVRGSLSNVEICCAVNVVIVNIWTV